MPFEEYVELMRARGALRISAVCAHPSSADPRSLVGLKPPASAARSDQIATSRVPCSWWYLSLSSTCPQPLNTRVELWPHLKKCALSGTIAPVESYLCRNLSVNCSVYKDTLSARFAASWISEPYRCPEMCWTSHLKFGPLCPSCLYSRQTFCGKTAQLS